MPRPIRTVVYCVLFVLMIVALAARAAPPVADEAERDVTTARMDETLASLRGAAANGGRLVIVLGDSSMLWHPPLKADETLTAMLEREGRLAGVTVRVVAHGGFDAVAYYLLVDEIAALRPAAVVLTANLQSFLDAWFRRVRMKHPELAAFIRPPRIPEAMSLPLELAGISDAALVVDPILRAIGASGLPEKIDGYRTRVRARLDGVAVEGAKAALANRVAHAEPPPPATAPNLPPVAAGLRPRRSRGKPAAPRTGPGAVTAKGAFRFMDLYPANLGREQSTARVLRATVRDLVARDVRTVVMLAPLHVQAAKLTGAYQTRNFPHAVRVVDELTVAAGGTFLDFAELLPHESFFVDRYTHFTAAGNRIVADRLIEELRRIAEPG